VYARYPWAHGWGMSLGSRKTVHSSNNVRQLLWEDEAYRLLRSKGLPNVLHMPQLAAM